QFLNENPGKREGNINDVRERIAHKERSRKIKNVSSQRLHALLSEQLGAAQRTEMYAGTLRRSERERQRTMGAAAAVTWAEEHVFERRSVVHEHELWRRALEVARGHLVTLAEIKAETARRDYVREGSG